MNLLIEIKHSFLTRILYTVFLISFLFLINCHGQNHEDKNYSMDGHSFVYSSRVAHKQNKSRPSNQNENQPNTLETIDKKLVQGFTQINETRTESRVTFAS